MAPRHRDQVRAAGCGAGVDAGVKRLFELAVQLLADQPVLKARAGAGHHRRGQAVLLQDRYLLRRRQIDALEADAREDLAALLEGEGRAHPPDRRHHALSDRRACLRGSLGRSILRGGERPAKDGYRSKAGEKVSSFHVITRRTRVSVSSVSLWFTPN